MSNTRQSETETSPGPWTLQDMRPYEETVNIRDKRNCYVAKVGGVDALPDRELWENARLIAAAPDLLHAAIAAYEAMTDEGDGAALPGFGKTQALLRAAIVRAEGGQE